MRRALTLWGAGTSRTLRPIWVAEELGVAYELKPIGPRTGETQTPEFTGLNPRQKIPLLVDGDFILSESLAICRYLIDAHPGAAIIVPETPQARALEDAWCCYIFGELDETSLYVMRRHRDLRHIYGEAPAVVAAAAAYASRHLTVIAGQLEDRHFIMPQGFGLADIMLMSCLDWAAAYAIELPEALRAYRSRLGQREGYRRACAINFG